MTVVTAQRDVPYRPDQMFALAADIERYPEFLPEYAAVRVERPDENELRVRQILRIAGRRFDVVTAARMHPPGTIEIRGICGPFRRLSIIWDFDPLDVGGCRIRYRMELETRSKLLELLAGRVMAGLAWRTLTNFERRAGELYGRATEPDISA